MSTTATLYSYFTIIQKLQQQPYRTQKELVAHVAKKLDNFREITGKAEKGLAPSSFHRTIKEIRTLLGVDIQCRKRDNTYFIAEAIIKIAFCNKWPMHSTRCNCCT